MDGFDVSFAGAFVAGVLSFFTPCVLPLVPPYLAFLGGATLQEIEDGGKAAQRRLLIMAGCFVLGFATIFVALGVSASMLGRFLAESYIFLAQLAGVVILILGLHFLGLFRIGFLYREFRVHPAMRPDGPVGAYLVGLAFAFGWTPCVGPVLAAVLTIAGAEENMKHGAGLLAVYAAGIGLPFMIAAFTVRPFLQFMRRFRNYVGLVEKILGIFLVVTGLVFIFDRMNEIGFWLLEYFPNLGNIG